MTGEDGWCVYGGLGEWTSNCAVSRRKARFRFQPFWGFIVKETLSVSLSVSVCLCVFVCFGLCALIGVLQLLDFLPCLPFMVSVLVFFWLLHSVSTLRGSNVKGTRGQVDGLFPRPSPQIWTRIALSPKGGRVRARRPRNRRRF